jgi:hypothetical protein
VAAWSGSPALGSPALGSPALGSPALGSRAPGCPVSNEPAFMDPGADDAASAGIAPDGPPASDAGAVRGCGTSPAGSVSVAAGSGWAETETCRAAPAALAGSG